jgi:hypothetical protein
VQGGRLNHTLGPAAGVDGRGKRRWCCCWRLLCSGLGTRVRACASQGGGGGAAGRGRHARHAAGEDDQGEGAAAAAHLDAAVGDVADLLRVELGPLLAVQLLHQRDDVLGAHLGHPGKGGRGSACVSVRGRGAGGAPRGHGGGSGGLPPAAGQGGPRQAAGGRRPTHHVDEGVADVALVLEVDGEVEEVKHAAEALLHQLRRARQAGVTGGTRKEKKKSTRSASMPLRLNPQMVASFPQAPPPPLPLLSTLAHAPCSPPPPPFLCSPPAASSACTCSGCSSP